MAIDDGSGDLYNRDVLKVIRLILAFICFFPACLFVLPVFVFRPFHRDNSWLFGQVVSGLTLRILGVKYHLDGGEIIYEEGPKILISNHQSTLDLFLLSHLCPKKTLVIGKKQLKWIPFFGWLFWLGGNFLIDRSNKQRALKCMQNVKDTLVAENLSVYILPEGTRSHGKGLGEFKKGAFHIGITSGVPIFPVILPHFHNQIDYNRWKAADLKIKVLPAIVTKGINIADIDKLVQSTRDKFIHELEALDQLAGIKPVQA